MSLTRQGRRKGSGTATVTIAAPGRAGVAPVTVSVALTPAAPGTITRQGRKQGAGTATVTVAAPGVAPVTVPVQLTAPPSGGDYPDAATLTVDLSGVEGGLTAGDVIRADAQPAGIVTVEPAEVTLDNSRRAVFLVRAVSPGLAAVVLWSPRAVKPLGFAFQVQPNDDA